MISTSCLGPGRWPAVPWDLVPYAGTRRREGPGQAEMSTRTSPSPDISSSAARSGGAGGPALVLVATVVVGVVLAGTVGVLFGLSLAAAALVVAAVLGGGAGL